jgi:hypothetical protein
MQPGAPSPFAPTSFAVSGIAPTLGNQSQFSAMATLSGQLQLTATWAPWSDDDRRTLVVAVEAIAQRERQRQRAKNERSEDKAQLEAMLKLAKLGANAARLAGNVDFMGGAERTVRYLREFADYALSVTSSFDRMGLRARLFLNDFQERPIKQKPSRRLIGELVTLVLSSSGHKGLVLENDIRRRYLGKNKLTGPIATYWRRNIKLMIENAKRLPPSREPR